MENKNYKNKIVISLLFMTGFLVLAVVVKTVILFAFGFVAGAVLSNLGEIKQLLTGKTNETVSNNNSTSTGAVQSNNGANDLKNSYNQEIQNLVNELRTIYSNYFNVDFMSETSRRSAEQLIRVVEKFEKFKEILDSKLDPNEMTYSRFFSTVEQVYFSILDNLKAIKDKFEAVGEIDVTYIEKRIEQLKNMDSGTQKMLDELSSLRNRRNMAKKELKDINDLISVNEGVTTEIDRIRIKIASINTTGNRANLDMDYNRAELEKLIERAHLYSE